MTDYAELAVTTNFSFLRGASHADELAQAARDLGIAAMGVADHETLAGVVRAHLAAKSAGIRFLPGARLLPAGGPALLCYPMDRTAYGRLSRLLSLGKRRAPKGKCALSLQDVLDAAEGQVMIAVAQAAELDAHAGTIAELKAVLGDRLYVGASRQYLHTDQKDLDYIAAFCDRHQLTMVAINDVQYHHPERRVLQDVLTCIREHTTLAEAGYLLAPHAERHFKSPAEMARLFQGFGGAIAATLEIVERCRFDLDSLRYEYPDEPVPADTTPQQHLTWLTMEGAKWRYPAGVPASVLALLDKELGLIAELDYAPYFLTVHDIVSWARAQGILCQGRGSAANSAVCFCLGITSVNPNEMSVLFERFLSRERREPPDIDVDFEHERREEVIQYIYRRYGRDRAALAATVTCYRPRSAVREVCKVLGLTPDVPAALARTVWGGWGREISPGQVKEAGLDPENPLIRQAIHLTGTLIGFPRHLSQHVGGFVLTRGPLIETVPIGNAAMPDRTFIEWDKDDIDALGIMKVDVLALGMLTCIRKAFDLLTLHKGVSTDMASLPPDDMQTYDMLCRADSVGVFQVESRAQMNMLPRLRPRNFYDLVIEVAIVRPGPIQGDMVHPYLRRRKGQEAVTFPAPSSAHGPPDELARILRRTLGVPLFQEQAMQISLDAARFTPAEANGLRRAMATFRRNGTIHQYEDMMVSRMVERGYEKDFAQRCFDQVKGFGEYGFPESHAASFALLVYVSSYMKCHYPDVFCVALLNAQPMGFYAPAQIIRDAREHGVEILPVDVNHSLWDNILEPRAQGGHAIRLGFRQLSGFAEEAALRIIAARGEGFSTPEDVRRRAGLGRPALEVLAAADAFGSLGLKRRGALWDVRGSPAGKPLPLFLAAGISDQGTDEEVVLPDMPPAEEVIEDYQTTHFSLKGHPMTFLRDPYRARGVVETAVANAAPAGRMLRTAGVVLLRQRPGSARGVCFATIEDETGIANLVIWPRTFERFRPVIMGARLLVVIGMVQRADGVTHIVAEQLFDRSADLYALREQGVGPFNNRLLAPADEVTRGSPDRRGVPPRHPRNVRILPPARDFH